MAHKFKCITEKQYGNRRTQFGFRETEQFPINLGFYELFGIELLIGNKRLLLFLIAHCLNEPCLRLTRVI